jgi:hypothetical protein
MKRRMERGIKDVGQGPGCAMPGKRPGHRPAISEEQNVGWLE